MLRPRRPGPARRDADHGPRQADLRRQPGEPRAGRGRPGAGRPPPVRPGRHRRLRSRRAARRRGRRGRQLRGRVARRPLDPRPRGVPADRRHRRPRPARGRAAPPPGRPRFLQVSTDEVYGSVEEGHSTEGDLLAPRSPYAAAKAAGELLVAAYFVTYGLDAVVTRGSNTYGPYQHPEKLIPLFVTNALDDQPLPLYGDGLQRRDWLYVADHAGAIEHVLRHGEAGETYNVPGGVELPNREVGPAPARTTRQAMVAASGTSRTGPGTTAATRWTARSWRRSAGGRRTSFEEGLARDGRLVRRQRGLVAGGAVGRLGRLLRAPVRSAAAVRRADARRRHGRRRAARPGAGRGAWARRRSPGPPGRSPGRGPTSTSTRPRSIDGLLERDRPEVVVHAAAWTDVDGCARDPDLAMRRNAVATAVARRAPAPQRGIDLLLISTNEVFDGTRTDGIAATRPDDPPSPANPYGASKLAGEDVGRRRVRGRDRRSVRDRPDGVAVRPAGQRLPDQDPRRRGPSARPPASRSRSSATRSARRPSRRRGRGDRRAAR